MDRFVLPWGRLRTTPVPILSPPFPHLSRPQQAEVVVAVLQDKSRWLARRRVPFRLEGRPRAPDLGPEPPIPRARSVHDKMAFVLSPLSLSLSLSSLQCSRFLPVVCSACAAWRETSVGMLYHISRQWQMADVAHSVAPRVPLPPALLRPRRPTPLAFASVRNRPFLGKVRKCSKLSR